MTLHLIRHGEIDSNVIGALDTAVPGPTLNQTGLAQASQLVEEFRGVPLEAIYASTATRTQMTAAPLAADRGLEINVRDGLKEIYAGSLEMSSEPTAQREYLGVLTAWMTGDLGAQLGGGTTGLEVLDRFDAVIDEIRQSGLEHTAIVAHGAVMVFWTAMRSPNLTGEVIEHHPPRNTGVASLTPASPDRLLSVTGQSAAGARPDWLVQSWMGVTL